MDPPLAVWLNGSVNARQGSPNRRSGPLLLKESPKLEWPDLPPLLGEEEGDAEMDIVASPSVK